MKKFFREFKKFITKGNVVDLAVAVIIGTAFNKIVSSLVADVITPLISLANGNVNFTDLKIVLRAATETLPEITLNYGQFIQYIIDFLVIGLTVFIMVRAYAKFIDSVDFNKNMCEIVQKKFNESTPLNKIEEKWYKKFKKHYPDKAPKTLEEQQQLNEVVEEPKAEVKPEPTETEKLLGKILEQLEKLNKTEEK